MQTSKHKIARETFWAFASKGAAMVGTYGLMAFFVLRMEVEAFGRWSFFTSLLSLLALCLELGLNNALQRWIVLHRDSPALGDWMASAWRLRLWLLAPAVAVPLALAAPLASWTGRPWLAGWLMAAIPWVALYAFVDFHKSVFEAAHRLRLTCTVNLVDFGLRLALGIAAYQLTGSILAVMAAYAAAAAVALYAGTLLRRRHLGPMGVPSGARNAELLRYAVPVFLMSMAGHFSTEIDTLMIGLMLDDRATGIFGLPKQLLAYLPHVSMAFTMGVVPALARDAATHPAAARRRFRRFLALLGLLYGLLVVTGTAAALWTPREWLPAGYAGSVAPFIALLPYVFFTALGLYTGALLSYCGHAASRLRFLVVTIALNIVLNLWWIPAFGVTGAAAASSVAMLPYFLLNWRRCERMLEQGARKPAGTGGESEP